MELTPLTHLKSRPLSCKVHLKFRLTVVFPIFYRVLCNISGLGAAEHVGRLVGPSRQCQGRESPAKVRKSGPRAVHRKSDGGFFGLPTRQRAAEVEEKIKHLIKELHFLLWNF